MIIYMKYTQASHTMQRIENKQLEQQNEDGAGTKSGGEMRK